MGGHNPRLLTQQGCRFQPHGKVNRIIIVSWQGSRHFTGTLLGAFLWFLTVVMMRIAAVLVMMVMVVAVAIVRMKLRLSSWKFAYMEMGTGAVSRRLVQVTMAYPHSRGQQDHGYQK